MAARGLVAQRLRGAAKTASSHHDRRLASSGNSPSRTDCSNSGFSTLITPPPAAPLLLAGDEMFISQDGKSHTIYRLEGRPNGAFRDVVLEESYDIEKARKKMSLIGPAELNAKQLQDAEDKTPSNKQADLFSFHLQEINKGVQKGAGTGSMTWESSVAMSLYFTENPHELKGNVLELGSGVGLGAIMTKVASELSSNSDDVSVTCTDVSDEVLEMLGHNVDEAAKSSTSGLFENSNFHIQKLDWFDFVGNRDKTNEKSQHYDTIIASDCAYLPSQVNPLSETISKLLGADVGQKMHMFAPANRSVIYELTDELRGTKNMNVQVESIELSKKRVKAEPRSSNYNEEPEEGPRGISRILHITAWHANNVDQTSNTLDGKKNMFDID